MTLSRVLIAALLIGFPLKGFCWGAMGHQIVGAIAEERMTPEARAYMKGILGIEPAYLAANFPDEVRDDDRFGHNPNEHDADKKDADDHNFADYHFVEIPVGYTYDNRPVKGLKDSFGAIKGALGVLRNSSFSREEKMLALRYLIHLVGDIHQPLHVGNGHDLGANLCSVFWKESSRFENLHVIWDTQFVDALGLTLKDPTNPKAAAPKYISSYMDALKKYRHEQVYAAKPTVISLAAIKSWMEDSAAIRENKARRPWGVYPEKAGAMDSNQGKEYMNRPYCKWFEDPRKGVWGSTSPKDIPPTAMPHLDDEYIQTNVKVVEQQLITAGIRLAALMDDLAAKGDSGMSTDAEEVILKTMQDVFHTK